MILWVIGSGGLFGSAVVRAARSQHWTVFEGRSIPWSDPDLAVGAIRADTEEFADTLKSGQSWGIVWAAGHATTASTQEEADRELSVFTRSLAAIRGQLGSRSNGVFLLASSAGGVYAGSENPPFDANTTPMPIGIYGNLKRQQEITAEQLLGDSWTVTVARLANLYGPGQNLGKLQGLISKLALTAVTKEKLIIFVPLDTLRDYIHVDDAARNSLDWLGRSPRQFQTRVIASGDSLSVGSIIGHMKDITRTRIPLAFGVHPSATDQARDLRLTADSPENRLPFPKTPLPAGMKNVFEDILSRYQGGIRFPT